MDEEVEGYFEFGTGGQGDFQFGYVQGCIDHHRTFLSIVSQSRRCQTGSRMVSSAYGDQIRNRGIRAGHSTADGDCIA